MMCLVTLFVPVSGDAAKTEDIKPEEAAALVNIVYPEPEAALEAEPVTASDPAPASTTEPAPAKVTVLAAGDLMCLSAQLNAARRQGQYQFGYCFEEIKGKISSADLAIGNFETLVAEGYPYTGRSPQSGSPKLNAPESYLTAVVGCGFDALINANNHIYDRKTDGKDKTINKIDEYGVYHTGAFATGEQRGPLVVDVKGIKIGILGYTDHLNGGGRGDKTLNMYREELVASDIAAAKAEGADYIIVYIHWGRENTHGVTKAQKKTADFIAKTGADIIIGSHPHCTQGTDTIQTDLGAVPVFYSLGNLISSMGRTINKDSLLVNMTLEKDNVTGETELKKLTYTPTLCAGTDAGSYVI
jgi:poly-gamma-glutamate synthesis protein (capsule biosynthesis protein)